VHGHDNNDAGENDAAEAALFMRSKQTVD